MKSIKYKLMILGCFLMVSCGSDSGKESKPTTPAKPNKPPVTSPAPVTPAAPVAPPAIQSQPVAPPTYPQVGGPTNSGRNQLADNQCPNGPVRRFVYNVFHIENCVE